MSNNQLDKFDFNGEIELVDSKARQSISDETERAVSAENGLGNMVHSSDLASHTFNPSETYYYHDLIINDNGLVKLVNIDSISNPINLPSFNTNDWESTDLISSFNQLNQNVFNNNKGLISLQNTVNGFLSGWGYDTPETNYTENHSAGSLYYIKTLTTTSNYSNDSGGTISDIYSNSKSTKPVIVIHHGGWASYDSEQHVYTINDLLLYFPEDVTTSDKISLSVEISEY